MNTVNCAFFAAFCLNMDEKPSLGKLTEYYSKAMMIRPMRWFCRMSGKRKFTPKDIRAMKEAARPSRRGQEPVLLEYGSL